MLFSLNEIHACSLKLHQMNHQISLIKLIYNIFYSDVNQFSNDEPYCCDDDTFVYLKIKNISRCFCYMFINTNNRQHEWGNININIRYCEGRK